WGPVSSNSRRSLVNNFIHTIHNCWNETASFNAVVKFIPAKLAAKQVHHVVNGNVQRFNIDLTVLEFFANFECPTEHPARNKVLGKRLFFTINQQRQLHKLSPPDSSYTASNQLAITSGSTFVPSSSTHARHLPSFALGTHCAVTVGV